MRKVRTGGTAWVSKAQEAAASRYLLVPRLTRAASTRKQRGGRQPAGLWCLAAGSSSHSLRRGWDNPAGYPVRLISGRRQPGLARGAGARGACQPVEKRCQGGGQGQAGGGALAAARYEGGSRSPGS